MWNSCNMSVRVFCVCFVYVYYVCGLSSISVLCVWIVQYSICIMCVDYPVYVYYMCGFCPLYVYYVCGFCPVYVSYVCGLSSLCVLCVWIVQYMCICLWIVQYMCIMCVDCPVYVYYDMCVYCICVV